MKAGIEENEIPNPIRPKDTWEVDEEKEERIENMEEGEEEGRNARYKENEYVPTDKEVENHVAQGHAIFRKWCQHCVSGRGWMTHTGGK